MYHVCLCGDMLECVYRCGCIFASDQMFHQAGKKTPSLNPLFKNAGKP